MNAEPLRYPLSSARGRHAIAALTAALVAMAVAFRYAAAFFPSSLALGPLVVGLLVCLLVAGYLTCVLVDSDSVPPAPSIRTVARWGANALAVATVFLIGPVLLLLATVARFGEADTSMGAGAATIFLAGSTGTLLLFLGVAYVLPHVIAARASGEPFRTAVDVRRLPGLRDTGYLLRWTTGFSLLIVAVGLFSLTLEAGGIVGLLSAVATAYLLLAGTRVVAWGDGTVTLVTASGSLERPSNGVDAEHSSGERARRESKRGRQ